MLLAICSAAQGLHAQTEEDVVRYGQTFTSGTGRYLGMGGAFNALGGDMSSLSSNPAGAAVFLSNELSFSLGANVFSANTSYLSMRADELSTRPVIPSLGLNGYFATKDPNSKWKAINVAYSYTRIKDFYNATTYRGSGAGSSLAETWANRATGLDSVDMYNGTGFAFDDMGSVLAYKTYLIDPDTNFPGYYNTQFRTGNTMQTYKLVSEGRMGGNTFIIGANYNNKLYIGGGFTVTGLTYDFREVDNEEDLAPSPYITGFTYRYNLSVRGTGYNAKVGMIYRVADMLRFGLSIQTPTSFRLNEVYFAGLSTRFSDSPTPEEMTSSELPINEGADFASNYNIVTPMKIGFGAAWLFGKKGLISIDYNRQDLGDSKFRNQSNGFDNYNIDFSFANEQLANYLGTINQIKVGAEAKIGKLTLRGGYGYQDNSFKVQNRLRATDVTSISGGVGFNFGSASLDFGLTNAKYTSDFTLYSDAGSGAAAGTVKARASSTNSITSAALTLVLRY